MPGVKKKSCIILILLALLLAPLIQATSASTVDYIARENPADVWVWSDTVDLKTMAILADLYQGLGKITMDINQSNYGQARADYQTFRAIYDNNKDVIWRLYESDLEASEALNATDLTVADMEVYLDNIQDYDDAYRLYANYTANGDMEKASAWAVKLKSLYRQLNITHQELHSSAGVSMELLDESVREDMNSSLLSPFMETTDSVMARLAIEDRSIRFESGNYDLKLYNSPGEAHIGDTVTYVADLRNNESPVEGANIIAYMGGRPVASGTTGQSGTCEIACKVPDTIGSSRLGVYAEYTPPGQLMLPAISDIQYLRILDESTVLTLTISTHEATFGDVINVTGRLTSARGFPAGSSDVSVYIDGVRIGKATTDDHGLYMFRLPITDIVPGGDCSVYAVHEYMGGSIFLSSSSSREQLYVTPQSTRLTIAADRMGANAGGDIALNGTLTAEKGMPVADVPVLAYAEDRQIGEGRTDRNGRYTIQAMIPYDSGSGNYSLYTVYRPANGSLFESSSDRLIVSVDAITSIINLNGMRLIFFTNDTMNITGSVRTSTGSPVRGQAITVKVSDIIGGTVKTDDSGNFYFMRTVNAYDPAGIFEVSAFILSSSSVTEPPSAVSGYVVILPFDRAMLVTSFTIILLLAFPIVLLANKSKRFEMLVQTVTGRSGPEPDLEDEPLEPIIQSTRPELPVRSFESMSADIDDAIGSGDLREASTRIYVAARAIASRKGVPVLDSHTHREFYKTVAAVRPAQAAPLKRVLDVYERMSYGPGDARASDVGDAYNALREFYYGLYGMEGALIR